MRKVARTWSGPDLVCQWAQMDLNHRPHPYQGCALTELSYGPYGRIKHPTCARPWGFRGGRPNRAGLLMK